MKQRMLMVGVALAFASATWAQGGCPYSANIMAPDDVRVSLSSPQSQFVLVQWEEVEDATRYVIYLQVFDDEVKVEAGEEIVEPATAQPTFVPWGRVQALPDREQYSMKLAADRTNPEFMGYGVSAEAQINGRWVSSPIVPARWVDPQISTAVEAVSWGQAKATAAE